MIDLTRWSLLSERSAEFAPITQDKARAQAEWLPRLAAFTGHDIDPESVIIRGARIVNGQRDFYFSRFAPEALNEVADLLPGRPVMRAHDYSTLPVGTFFAAQRVLIPRPKWPQRDCLNVEALFYMPNDEEGQAVARRIDLGTWREMSLGWKSLSDECSLCHESIRSCQHIPGEVYDDGLCDYEMSGVVAVAEGSFVFAGGQKDTETFNPERSHPMLGDVITGAQLIAYKRARVEGATDDDLERMLVTVRAKNSEGMRTSVQSLVMSKERFDTSGEAAKWARGHSFRADKVDENTDSFRFRQFAPEGCAEGSFRTIRLDDGIAAVICKRGKSRVAPEDPADEIKERDLDSLFS